MNSYKSMRFLFSRFDFDPTCKARVLFIQYGLYGSGEGEWANINVESEKLPCPYVIPAAEIFMELICLLLFICLEVIWNKSSWRF